MLGTTKSANIVCCSCSNEAGIILDYNFEGSVKELNITGSVM